MFDVYDAHRFLLRGIGDSVKNMGAAPRDCGRDVVVSLAEGGNIPMALILMTLNSEDVL